MNIVCKTFKLENPPKDFKLDHETVRFFLTTFLEIVNKFVKVKIM